VAGFSDLISGVDVPMGVVVAIEEAIVGAGVAGAVGGLNTGRGVTGVSKVEVGTWGGDWLG
jgi:hypothetical protein